MGLPTRTEVLKIAWLAWKRLINSSKPLRPRSVTEFLDPCVLECSPPEFGTSCDLTKPPFGSNGLNASMVAPVIPPQLLLLSCFYFLTLSRNGIQCARPRGKFPKSRCKATSRKSMRLEMVSRRLHFDLVQSWSSAAKSGAISDTSLHDESVKTLSSTPHSQWRRINHHLTKSLLVVGKNKIQVNHQN